jgi:hypothetical protein
MPIVTPVAIIAVILLGLYLLIAWQFFGVTP